MCWWYLLSHLGDGREHESDYIDLMSLSLEQNREIQRIPQTAFLKEIVIVFQQSISFYLTEDFCEGVLFQILSFFVVIFAREFHSG